MRTCSSPKLWVGVAVGLLCSMNVGAVADELGRRPPHLLGSKIDSTVPCGGCDDCRAGPQRCRSPRRDRGILQRHPHPSAGVPDGRAPHGTRLLRRHSAVGEPIVSLSPNALDQFELATCPPADHASLDSPVPAAARLRSHLSGRFSRPGSRHLGHRTGDSLGAGDRRSTVQAGAGERPRVARRVETADDHGGLWVSASRSQR